MTFSQEIFDKAVKNYVSGGCLISTDLNDLKTMNSIYSHFKHWNATKGNIHDAEGSTIQQFGRSLRKLEHEWNIQLVRGRSGKTNRWVEVYVQPREDINDRTN